MGSSVEDDDEDLSIVIDVLLGVVDDALDSVGIQSIIPSFSVESSDSTGSKDECFNNISVTNYEVLKDTDSDSISSSSEEVHDLSIDGDTSGRTSQEEHDLSIDGDTSERSSQEEHDLSINFEEVDVEESKDNVNIEIHGVNSGDEVYSTIQMT